MIYKYRVGKIKVPSDSRFLFADYQGNELMVWVEYGKLDLVTFDVDYIGTGWEDDWSDRSYLNSVKEGSFIWHVFYKQVKD